MKTTSDPVLDLCASVPIIPVLVVDDAAHAARLAEVLVASGLPVLEVTLRTQQALDVIREMAKVPGAQVGAGTVLDAQQAQQVKDAGATFAVSPGATPELLDACDALGLPLLPGAATASEVMALRARGYRMLKFFPAEAAGGVAALKGIGGPIPDVSFCPTGGVSPQNMAAYLGLPNVVCVGGSWIATRQQVADQDWDVIGQNATKAVADAGGPRG